MSIDHGKLLALADRVDDVCTRMTSKDGFLSPESDPRRLLWQIVDELREAAAAIAKLAESIDMVTAEHIGGCPFTGTPNSISSCACVWWLAHDAAQPAEAREYCPCMKEDCPKCYAIQPAEAVEDDHWSMAAQAAVSHLDYETDAPQAVKAALRQLSAALNGTPAHDAAQGAAAFVGSDGRPAWIHDGVGLGSPTTQPPGTLLYTHPQAAPAQGDE